MTNSQKDICIKTMLNVCQKPSKIKEKKLFVFKIHPIGKVCKTAIQWLYDVSDIRFNNIVRNHMKDIIFKNIHTNITENEKTIENETIENETIENETIENEKLFNVNVLFELDELLCPISKGLMYTPVLASDGFNYEESSIYEWLETVQKSPITNLKIKKSCYKNVSLQCKIKNLVEKFKKSFLNNYEFQDYELSVFIDWIIIDSECEYSKTQKDSLSFLVQFYDLQKNSLKAIEILKQSGNEKELLSYLHKNNMKEEMTRFIIDEYPIMETYFSFDNK